MTSLPEMNIPDVPYKEYDITFYDGTMRHIYVTDVCISSKKFDTIASKADTKGFITDVNDAFVQISGYKKEDLIGQPHYILRHPDMPDAAFEEMWETISGGEIWFGNVKNLCIDGSYYWVKAVVSPVKKDGKIVAYSSVRRWIDDDAIAKTEAEYSKLIATQNKQS